MDRRVRAATLSAAIVAAAGQSAFGVTDTWLNAVNGSWPESAKWSAGEPDDGLGNVNYDVVVAATGPAYTVGLYSNVSIDSLLVNSANATVSLVYADLELYGGNLTIAAGTFNFSNSALHDAHIYLASPASFASPQSVYATLDNITLCSDINLPGVTVLNGLTLSNITTNAANLTFTGSNQTLGGNGTVIGPVNGTALVVTPGITVQTRGNLVSFADNQGTMVINGNVTLSGDWSNEGTITLANNSVIHLQGNHTVSSLGTIINNGATTYLDGALNAAGTNFDMGSLGVSTITGSVTGGTFHSSAKAGLFLQNATLNGTTLASNAGETGLHLLNNFALSNCSMSLAGTLSVPGNQTIGGNGTLTFGALAGQYGATLGVAAGNLTLDPGITLTTVGSVSGGETFSITGASLLNHGVINVSNPAVTLQIATSTWANDGTLSVSDGTLRLLGTFTTANLGNIVHTGGSLQLNGTLDNTGATFTLDAAHGAWNSYGGTIIGGTLISAGGSLVGSNITLSGVTLQGDFTPSGLQAFNATNNLTLNGATLPLTGTLGMVGNETLAGTGTVKFQYANFTAAAIGGINVSLTIAPGITVEADTSGGTIGNQYNPYTITNQGTILSTLSRATMSLYGTVLNQGNITQANGYLNIGTLVNSGTVTASNTTVTITGLLTNTGSLVLGNSTLAIHYDPADVAGNISHTGPTVLVGNYTNLPSPLDVAATPFGPVTLGNGSLFSNLTLVSSNGPISVASQAVVTLNATLASDLVIPQASTVVGNMVLQNANVTLTGSSTVAASLETNSVTGTGAILFGGPSLSSPVISFASNSTLTIGPGITVRGDTEGGIFYASSGILNSGTINPNGQTLWFRSNITNSGNLTVFSGCIVLQANLTNSGNISLSGNGAIVISKLASPGGTLTRSGGIVATSASISSTTTDLGTTSWGQVDLDDATFNSLTLKSSAGPISVYNLFSINPSVYPTTVTTFSNVTLASNLTIQPSATLSVNGTLTLTGTAVHLAGGGASLPATLSLNNSAYVVGPGSIIFDGTDSASNLITGSSLVGSGTTLATGTGGGVLSGVALSIGGTVSAQTLNTSITIQNTSVSIAHGAIVQALNGGAVIISSAVNNSGTLSIGAGSSVIINSKLTENANATITGAGTLNVASLAGSPTIPLAVNITGTALNNLTALTIAGTSDQWTGRLDLGNADALVHAGAIGTIQNQLREGYNGGDWAGGGGITSSTAASSTGAPLGIALMSGTDYLNATGSSTFDGVTYSATYTLLKLEVVGDANLDGKVDLNDLNIVLNNLGSASASWTAGNFDYAPTIDLNDLNAVLNNLGFRPASGSAAVAEAQAILAGVGAVPEPGTLTGMALGGVVLATRRRKREVGG